MVFNRNIFIQKDIDNLVDPEKKNPKTMTANPPSGFVPTSTLVGAEQAGAVSAGGMADEKGGAGPAAPSAVTVPTKDDYLTKLVKYVPVEVVAAYLFMGGVIDANVTDKHDHAIWLGGLLIGILVLTIPYDRQVLGVVRWSQLAVSVVGMAVYIFSLGGWFATTTWYHSWYASIVLPVFGIVIAIFKLPALPDDSNG